MAPIFYSALVVSIKAFLPAMFFHYSRNRDHLKFSKYLGYVHIFFFYLNSQHVKDYGSKILPISSRNTNRSFFVVDLFFIESDRTLVSTIISRYDIKFI